MQTAVPMKAYRSREWREVRGQALEVADYTCERCLRKEADGLILHVHHRVYRPGAAPWEYSLGELEVLCAGCHAQEHGVIRPSDGWEVVGYEDLGEVDGECDLCGTAIRHVYAISHPKWHSLEVGSDCCDNLTNTDIASKHEHERRKHLARRRTFIRSPKWTEGMQPGSMRQDGPLWYRLVEHSDGIGISIAGVQGKLRFANAIQAGGWLFEFIESLDGAQYLEDLKRRIWRRRAKHLW